MIEVRGLTKRYGDKAAVEDLSFEVRPGSVTGFLGPNGSGKSTTVKMVIGMIQPTRGKVFFDGRNITALRPDQRAMLGLARSFQITSLFLDFTALDNVALAVQAQAGHSFRFWADARRGP